MMNEYKYEYFLKKTYYTNTNMNIIPDTLGLKYEEEYYMSKIFANIFEYSNIFEYLKIIKSQVTATYQSKDCG